MPHSVNLYMGEEMVCAQKDYGLWKDYGVNSGKTTEGCFPPASLHRRHSQDHPEELCQCWVPAPKLPSSPPCVSVSFPHLSHLWLAHNSVHDSGSKQLSYDLVAKYLDKGASKQKTFQCKNPFHPSTPLPQSGWFDVSQLQSTERLCSSLPLAFSRWGSP